MTEKELNFNKVIKARLVVRGFEEEGDMQRDSPTTAKDTLRVFFALSASKKWECTAIDVKANFLQGHDIERNEYVLPPKEADVADGNINNNFAWKLSRHALLNLITYYINIYNNVCMCIYSMINV